VRRGTIAQVTSASAEAQRLRDLKLLRRVRDRMDREYAQPLDVEALARGVNMSAGHLSRQFRLAYGESSTRFTELVGMAPSTYQEKTAGVTEGMPSCVEKQVTRPIRNREAPITALHLA
jgi:transcriptional regulator GlxA family with amidase domain